MLQRAASNACSWWWASHIRTKQSKWLEQSMQDMEEKVQSMLKLIEEDGDSFAKRAEMYYKRRPEIISSVEETFRVFKALADRYDILSKELQNANHTIATVFPEQVQFSMDDDEDFPAQKMPKKSQMPPPVKATNVPEVPKAPIENLPGLVSTPQKQFKPKKPLKEKAARVKAAVTKSGLSKDEALVEIDKVHKEILTLQTVKEFVKSSYESGLAKYWDIENQIVEMQERVCKLQDEFDVEAVIEDNEARTLMAEAALKSCQETLAALEEKQANSTREAKEEFQKIESARQVLDSLRKECMKEQTDDNNNDVKQKPSREDDDDSKREVSDLIHESNGSQNSPNDLNLDVGSLTVTELAEKIDELVNKVINLETAVSSQTVLIDTLRTEAGDLHAQVRNLEKEKESLIGDTNYLSSKVKEMEEKLSRLDDLNKNVERKNSNLQSDFAEARNNLGQLSEKLSSVKPDEENEEDEEDEESDLLQNETVESSSGFKLQDVGDKALKGIQTQEVIKDQKDVQKQENIKDEQAVQSREIVKDLKDDAQSQEIIKEQKEDVQSPDIIKEQKDHVQSPDIIKEPKDDVQSQEIIKEQKDDAPSQDIIKEQKDDVQKSQQIAKDQNGDVQNQEIIKDQKDVCSSSEKSSNASKPEDKEEVKEVDIHVQDQEPSVPNEEKPVRKSVTFLDVEPKQLAPEDHSNEVQDKAKEDDLSWQQMLLSGTEDRERILLKEYTAILRNYKDVKKRLSDTEKKERDTNFDVTVQLRELKETIIKKDQEIQNLRHKLSLLQANNSDDKEEQNPPVNSSEDSEANNNEDEIKMVSVETSPPMSIVEEKLRMEIDAILDENLDFWLRFSTTFHQVQKFKSEVQDLQEEITKLKEKKKQEGVTIVQLKSEARPIYKHLSEIDTELTLWLEQSASLKDELKRRFSSLCTIQEEITKALKEGVEEEKIRFSSHQAAKLQGEILNMKQENNKVREELQAGVDHVSVLQIEIEKTLKQLHEEFGISSDQPQLEHSMSRSRVPLRSFIFGSKPKKQRHSIFSFMQTNRKFHVVRTGAAVSSNSQNSPSPSSSARNSSS